MTWALVIIVLWVMLASMLGLVIGRGIRMADREGAGWAYRAGGRLTDVEDVNGVARAATGGAGSARSESPRR